MQTICVNLFYIYGYQETLLESVGFCLPLECWFSSTLGSYQHNLSAEYKFGDTLINDHKPILLFTIRFGLKSFSMFCVMPDQISKTLSRFLLWICLAALPLFSFILEDFKFLCGQIGTTLPSQKVSYFLKDCTFSAVHWNSSQNIKPQRSKSLFQSKLKIPMLYLFVDTGRTMST